MEYGRCGGGREGGKRDLQWRLHKPKRLGEEGHAIELHHVKEVHAHANRHSTLIHAFSCAVHQSLEWKQLPFLRHSHNLCICGGQQ